MNMETAPLIFEPHAGTAPLFHERADCLKQRSRALPCDIRPGGFFEDQGQGLFMPRIHGHIYNTGDNRLQTVLRLQKSP